MPLLSRLRATDLNHYMPGAVLAKVDRMSMQHALEVRCPILSLEVARFAEKLATSHCYAEGQGKLVLKEVGSRYIPRAWLERKKLGFSVPIHLWEKEKFITTLSTLALGPGGLLPQFLDPARIEQFIARQRTNNGFSAYQIWSLLILELWLRNHAAISSRIHAPIRSRLSRRPAYFPRPSTGAEARA